MKLFLLFSHKVKFLLVFFPHMSGYQVNVKVLLRCICLCQKSPKTQ